MDSCQAGSVAPGGDSAHIVQCNGLEVGMPRKQGEIPMQLPFAVVLGCSDARVPTEMLFGQGFNDLFVIRVAGNVIGDVCMGSVDFALSALSESVKVFVVLGHSGCGAVTGAVDAYLTPVKFWSKSVTPMLRSITQEIFVAVREAANGFHEVWGRDASAMPGYREALINSAVCINAAHTAFNLRQEVERAGKWDIEALFGVFNLLTHQVCMPPAPRASHNPDDVHLEFAPTNPLEFQALAVRMAELHMPQGSAQPPAGSTPSNPPTSSRPAPGQP